ncbi:MAG: hypothetical protein IJI24_05770 [Lachnospiraceae bacterium]|nr:hypothetical protein [Lachnospiraceae bacterium]
MDHDYDKLRIHVHTEMMGDDLCVNIYGGDRAHIGSVAIAEPRPSLTCDGSISATVSTYNCLGHKDGEVAEAVAQALASGLNHRTVVVCGIHYNTVTAGLLEEIGKITELIIRDILLSGKHDSG